MTATHPRARPHKDPRKPNGQLSEQPERAGPKQDTVAATHPRFRQNETSCQPKDQTSGRRKPIDMEQGDLTSRPEIMDGNRTITVRVPLAIRKRGGRKLILAPDGVQLSAAPVHCRINSTLVKAIARAFRWREMLENGNYATVREIASAQKINETYVGRILRLTLLAPDIVEAIINGRQGIELQLERLTQQLPVEWEVQGTALGLTT